MATKGVSYTEILAGIKEICEHLEIDFERLQKDAALRENGFDIKAVMDNLIVDYYDEISKDSLLIETLAQLNKMPEDEIARYTKDGNARRYMVADDSVAALEISLKECYADLAACSGKKRVNSDNHMLFEESIYRCSNDPNPVYLDQNKDAIQTFPTFSSSSIDISPSEVAERIIDTLDYMQENGEIDKAPSLEAVQVMVDKHIYGVIQDAKTEFFSHTAPERCDGALYGLECGLGDSVAALYSSEWDLYVVPSYQPICKVNDIEVFETKGVPSVIEQAVSDIGWMLQDESGKASDKVVGLVLDEIQSHKNQSSEQATAAKKHKM